MLQNHYEFKWRRVNKTIKIENLINIFKDIFITDIDLCTFMQGYSGEKHLESLLFSE